MKVLLLSANTETLNMPTLPMGLGCVAAAARDAGHQVRFLDLMGETEPEPVIERTIAAFGPEVIGISIRNIDDQNSEHPRFLIEGAREVTAVCRHRTDAPLVLGGAGYSLFPEAALDYLEADMGIQGEGEAAFLDLLGRLADRRSLSGVPGLYLRGRGLQGPRQFIRRLEAWPAPDPALFDLQRVRGDAYYLPFQTRRGCPLDCSYCATSEIEGSIIRKRPVDAVVRDLRRWRNAGFRRLFFVDNTFNLPPTYARELCEAMAAADLGLEWRAIVYPGRMDDALATAMARAGCTEVSLGFESGSAPVLAGMGKHFAPDEIRRCAGFLENAGIRQMGFLLLGGPDETRDTAAESLAFVDSLGLDAVKLTVGIRIYPHTKLAALARSEGRLDPADDLFHPRFYLKPGLETWLRRTVSEWMATRPNWMM